MNKTIGVRELQMLQTLFRDEVEDTLNRITSHLVGCTDSPPSMAVLTEIIRATHTLKGSAGTVELHDIVELTHQLEDQFAQLQSGQQTWSRSVLDQLLESIDVYRVQTNSACNPANHQGQSHETSDTEDVSDGVVRESTTQETTRTIVAKKHRPAQKSVYSHPIDAPPMVYGENKKTNLLRVELSRIDDLITRTRTLVHNQESIVQHTHHVRQVIANIRRIHIGMNSQIAPIPPSPVADNVRMNTLQAWAEELHHQLDTLSQVGATLVHKISSIRETCMDIHLELANVRVLSAQTLFQRITPTIRRIAQRCQKGVQLRTTGEDTEFDQALAEQISDPLIQLLRNAIAHGIETMEERIAQGKPARGEIHLGAQYLEDCIVLEVSDDGNGIDPQTLRHRFVASGRWTQSKAKQASDEQILQAIFDPGISTRIKADSLAGRGVGLNVVRETVGRLGGEIRMTTTPGKGTRFELILPATTSVHQPLLPRERARTTILIVDDSPTIREAASQILAAEGYHVRCVPDGAQAWRLLQDTKKYDVVVTDLEMPEMDGFELVRRIRCSEVLCALNIVIISSRGTQQTRHDARMLHVHEFVSKPIVRDHLIRAVRSALLTI